MIEVRGLEKEYIVNGKNFKALDGVTFEVKNGEVFGVIGLSGAGKSTLVRCLNRLEEADGGEIVIDGKSILALTDEEVRKERKSIGMIFQSFNLFNQKSVYQNIAYPLEIIGWRKKEIENRVDELLGFIGLYDKKNSYPKELSGGQKQRVAIARALATNPKILLCDEATSALDPSNTSSILELLKNIVKEYKTTIIMITHQMEVAKEICDRIAVMKDGKIVEENSTEELFRHPKSDVTKSFIQNLSDEDKGDIIDALDYDGDVLRITYSDVNFRQPILGNCIKTFDVNFSIISGNINKLNLSTVGYLIVELIGEKKEREKAIDFLKKNKINVEVIQ